MTRTRWNMAGFFVIAMLVLSCGRKEESTPGEAKSKVKEAVKEVVTQDFKIYEGAKKSLGTIERESEERSKEIEKELK